MSSTQQRPLPDDWESWDLTKLESEIEGHNRAYWDEDSPTISDYDYDRLIERLRALAPDSSLLDHLGPSFVDVVGEVVTHAAPMLSLDKCYQEEGLLKWAEKFEGAVIMTPKIDGVACSLRYNERGELYLAATRGDGTHGESITPNVTQMASIPTKIPPQGVEVEVRGEVYLPLSAFASLTDRFSNPRNAAAGTLKRKHDLQAAQVGLKFFAYDLFGVDRERAAERLDLASEWGFEPVPYEVLERDQLQAGYEGYVARRDELDYEIDGVVYRADLSAEYERLGATSHHPRGAIAYKLQGESARTILERVEWGVSRNGVLTPVGVVKPVKLSGAMVSRISLHHWGMVKSKGLSIGAEVIAMRRGGVIPHLETVVKPGGDEICAPERCPQCPHLNAPTRVEGDVLYCAHSKVCEPQAASILSYWVSVTKIEGFGSVWLETLTREGILKTPVDLYTLKSADVLHLDGVGEVRAQRWIESVNMTRELPLATFLCALGVRDLGKSASRAIAEHYGSLSAVRAARIEEIEAIHQFGALTARTITEGLTQRASLIDALLEHIKVLDQEKIEPRGSTEGALTGKSFVFTGTLVSMKRAEAQTRVQSLGGSTPSGVSAKLSYLVIGDEGKAGSKRTKAEKHGVPILSESDFLALLASAEPTHTLGDKVEPADETLKTQTDDDTESNNTESSAEFVHTKEPEAQTAEREERTQGSLFGDEW